MPRKKNPAKRPHPFDALVPSKEAWHYILWVAAAYEDKGWAARYGGPVNMVLTMARGLELGMKPLEALERIGLDSTGEFIGGLDDGQVAATEGESADPEDDLPHGPVGAGVADVRPEVPSDARPAAGDAATSAPIAVETLDRLVAAIVEDDDVAVANTYLKDHDVERLGLLSEAQAQALLKRLGVVDLPALDAGPWEKWMDALEALIVEHGETGRQERILEMVRLSANVGSLEEMDVAQLGKAVTDLTRMLSQPGALDAMLGQMRQG